MQWSVTECSLLLHMLSEIEGFCCHINANGRRACRGIMCNYGLNRNFLRRLIHFGAFLSGLCTGRNHRNPSRNWNCRQNSFNVAGDRSQSAFNTVDQRKLIESSMAIIHLVTLFFFLLTAVYISLFVFGIKILLSTWCLWEWQTALQNLCSDSISTTRWHSKTDEGSRVKKERELSLL